MGAPAFRLKNYIQGKERLLAACDEEVLGRRLREGRIQLEVRPDFYDGLRGDADDVERYLRTSTVANLVGQNVVDLAIRLGFVAPENVLTIEGVPHAQWALML